MSDMNTDEAIEALLPLMARSASVLHGSTVDGDRGSAGGDIDCVVSGLEPSWPLRLDPSWKLCQCLHYDLKAWYWVLDRDGDVIALDVLDDPRGLGRDAFHPTPNLVSEGLIAPPHQRAAYLTAKRIRKGIRDADEWDAIGELARQEPDPYARELGAIFGETVGGPLSAEVLSGRVPHPDLWKRARASQLRRRVGGPLGPVRALVLGGRRITERVLHPTGIFVLVVGPDGAGKSTVADALPRVCAQLFRRYRHVHWRPGLLPRPGALLRREESDPSEPHARSAYGKLPSLGLLAYYWADFFVGGWLQTAPTRTRSGMVVVERGWWDLAVDPARYRLQVPERLVRVLGALLPHPDLAFVLGSSAELLQSRKPELPPAELARQLDAWQRALPRRVQKVDMDTSAEPHEVAETLRREIVDRLEQRSVSRLGPGWANLPFGNPRWWLPRGPVGAAKGALSIYQPVTGKARAGWEGARFLTAVGGFRLLPRGQAPPRSVRAALAPHIPAGGTFAVARSNRPGRHVAVILGRHGEPLSVAKVTSDAGDADTLAREARSIQQVQELLPPPLSAPRILAQDEGLFLMEALRWRPRAEPWSLPVEVAAALGQFFRTGQHPGGSRGLTHGDFAPWNLLRTESGWTLVDWEEFRADGSPFFDLFHYVVQSHALLGKPSMFDIGQGLRGRGWIGEAISAYAEGACPAVGSANEWFVDYLRQSRMQLKTNTTDGRRGIGARDALLSEFGSRG